MTNLRFQDLRSLSLISGTVFNSQKSVLKDIILKGSDKFTEDFTKDTENLSKKTLVSSKPFLLLHISFPTGFYIISSYSHHPPLPLHVTSLSQFQAVTQLHPINFKDVDKRVTPALVETQICTGVHLCVHLSHQYAEFAEKYRMRSRFKLLFDHK
ncbi:hypothetical protein CTI12_AA245700 [Artemisia annua]|uniref:Uncharacterized protein n=1 Tax=Artemisia annua TaxID=35608 RepID=A0A2U1NMZ3_ARTAN|nr:hypothetical protein CTI12_AA245700 [Artemisia annua]